MKLLIGIILSLTILSSGGIAYSQTDLIPSWIKGIVEFWAEDKITDTEFIEALEFLMESDIIKVSDPRVSELENEIIELNQKIKSLESEAMQPAVVIEPTPYAEPKVIEGVVEPKVVISVQTNDIHYDEGDTIVVSGTVNTIIDNASVIVQLFVGGNLVGVEAITVSQEGTFAKGFLTEGASWKKSGEYTVIASYQDYKVETKFNYTPKSESIETTEYFEVSAGYETFDIEYTIKGGTIKDIVVDENISAVIVQLESIDDGTITLDLPRELIDAKKQDGKDETFIILIDGVQVAYQEPTVHSESRVITINFKEGDSNIEIIGKVQI